MHDAADVWELHHSRAVDEPTQVPVKWVRYPALRSLKILGEQDHEPVPSDALLFNRDP